jgi:hypothetical protein
LSDAIDGDRALAVAYAPPFSPVWYPVLVAARQAAAAVRDNPLKLLLGELDLDAAPARPNANIAISLLLTPSAIRSLRSDCRHPPSEVPRPTPRMRCATHLYRMAMAATAHCRSPQRHRGPIHAGT